MSEQVKFCNVATLRAMARNYADGHRWDYLDGNAVISAADEIVSLQAECERLQETVNGIDRQNDYLADEIARLTEELAAIKAQQQ